MRCRRCVRAVSSAIVGLEPMCPVGAGVLDDGAADSSGHGLIGRWRGGVRMSDGRVRMPAAMGAGREKSWICAVAACGCPWL